MQFDLICSSSYTKGSSNPDLEGVCVRADPPRPKLIGPAKDYGRSSACSGCENLLQKNVISIRNQTTEPTSCSDELASLLSVSLSLKD